MDGWQPVHQNRARSLKLILPIRTAIFKTRHMKIRFCVYSGATFALIGSVVAGTLELQPKETAPPSITESEPWQFTIASPGWLASLNGTIGVRGVNADIDIPVDEILQHLDMIFAVR